MLFPPLPSSYCFESGGGNSTPLDPAFLPGARAVVLYQEKGKFMSQKPSSQRDYGLATGVCLLVSIVSALTLGVLMTLNAASRTLALTLVAVTVGFGILSGVFVWLATPGGND